MSSGLPTSVIENLLIINKSHQREHILLLYTSQIDRMDVFASFLKEGSYAVLPFYISTGFTDKKIQKKFKSLHLRRECEVFFGYNDMDLIMRKLRRLYRLAERGNPLRMILDYCGIPQLTDENIIEIERSIHEKKRLPISVTSAFDTSNMDYEILTSIQKFHDMVLIITENRSTALIYGNKHTKDREPALGIISKNGLEKMVKDNLRLIVLGILSKNEASGYDIIKSIDEKFHTKLSPGTMYPLLYSLKEEGVIEMKDVENDLRKKIYLPTKDGKKIIENELSNFLSARRYLSDFLWGGWWWF